ncbi:MAG: AMP-binding protein [Candidatus Lokiarchaeota archaeon]|nr:AMP-binding protein [Candidatus Lokiarchaeota archaeon]
MSEEKIYYKFWPEDVPKQIKIPEISLDQYLRRAARDHPDAIATTYYGVPLSYKKLDDIADRIATALSNMGLKKGETVALHFTNVPPCVACYYGILRAGGRVTLLSPLFQKLEIKYQLNDSEAKILIVWEGFDSLVEPVIAETGVQHVIHSNLGNWFSPDPTTGDKVSEDGSTLFLEDLIISTEPNPPKIEINPKEDLACLQYTGGTTGLPKGAMLTHYNLIANCEQIKAWFPEANVAGEVMLTALPLYHIYAQTTCMNFSVCLASNQILIANPRDTEELLEAIEEHKVTIFPGVAALYNNINNYKGVEKHDLSCIKYCVSGAGPLPAEVQAKFEKLTGAKLREGYGLTEASPVAIVNPLAGRYKNGTIGLPISNTEIKIVSSDSGEELPINEPGELLIKGPQVMKGYYKRPDRNKVVLADGWLHTGDIALIDEEGYTVIKARIKNLIKYKGHSVYPAEIEEFLYEHPAILECGVIGIPDEKSGETIKAFITLKKEYEGKVTEQDIIDWSKENMAKYKYPRFVEFIPELPKTNTGKVLHRLLREGNYDI